MSWRFAPFPFDPMHIKGPKSFFSAFFPLTKHEPICVSLLFLPPFFICFISAFYGQSVRLDLCRWIRRTWAHARTRHVHVRMYARMCARMFMCVLSFVAAGLESIAWCLRSCFDACQSRHLTFASALTQNGSALWTRLSECHVYRGVYKCVLASL